MRRAFRLPEKAGPDALVTMPNARHFTCIGSARERWIESERWQDVMHTNEGTYPVSTGEMTTEKAIAAEEVIEGIAAKCGLPIFGWPVDEAPREIVDAFGTQAKRAGDGDPFGEAANNNTAVLTILVLREDVPIMSGVYRGHADLPASYIERVGRWRLFAIYGAHE